MKPERHEITIKLEPITQRHILTGPAIRAGYRPKIKDAAKVIADYILQNGFITEHGPLRKTDMDASDYAFVFYAYKPERGLP